MKAAAGSMFTDDLQRARACRVLLSTMRLDRLWTDDGPGPQARAMLRSEVLTDGERAMLRAALDVWDGSGGLQLAEAIAKLDGVPMEALCSLLVAMQLGSGAVEDWIARTMEKVEV